MTVHSRIQALIGLGFVSEVVASGEQDVRSRYGTSVMERHNSIKTHAKVRKRRKKPLTHILAEGDRRHESNQRVDIEEKTTIKNTDRNLENDERNGPPKDVPCDLTSPRHQRPVLQDDPRSDLDFLQRANDRANNRKFVSNDIEIYRAVLEKYGYLPREDIHTLRKLLLYPDRHDWIMKNIDYETYEYQKTARSEIPYRKRSANINFEWKSWWSASADSTASNGWKDPISNADSNSAMPDSFAANIPAAGKKSAEDVLRNLARDDDSENAEIDPFSGSMKDFTRPKIFGRVIRDEKLASTLLWHEPAEEGGQSLLRGRNDQQLRDLQLQTTSTTSTPMPADETALMTPEPATTPKSRFDYGDVTYPVRYICETKTCSPYDAIGTWIGTVGGVTVNVTSDGQECYDAVTAELATFWSNMELTYRAFPGDNVDYCYVQVCNLYERIFNRIRPDKNNRMLPRCEPYMYWNATMCVSEYRDVKYFCECFWTGKQFWVEPSIYGAYKYEQILEYFQLRRSQYAKRVFDFLLVGKRFMNDKLMSIRFFDVNMGKAMCDWGFELADPRRRVYYENAADQLYLPPDECLNMEWPNVKDQCNALLSSDPYDVCPWLAKSTGPTIQSADTGGMISTATGGNLISFGSADDTLTCMDGSTCSVDKDGDTCCYGPKMGKKKCEPRRPIMCRQPYECAGTTDHCCVEKMELCSDQLRRECAPNLDPVTQEQRGELPIQRRPSYYQELIQAQLGTTKEAFVTKSTTTTPPVVIEQVKNLVWYALIGTLLGLIALVIGGYMLMRSAYATTLRLDRFFTKDVSKKIAVMEEDQVTMPKTGDLGKHYDQYDAKDRKDRATEWRKKKDTQPSEFDAYNAQTEKERKEIEELEEILRESEDAQVLQMSIEKGKRLNMNADLLLEAEGRYTKIRDGELQEIFDEAEKAIKLDWSSERKWEITEKLYRMTITRTDLPLPVQEKSHRYRTELLGGCNLPPDRIMLDEEAGVMKVLAPTAARIAGQGSYVVNKHNPMGVAEVFMNFDAFGAGPCCAHFVQKGHCRLGKDCPYRHATPGPRDRVKEPIDLRSRKETIKPISRFGV